MSYDTQATTHRGVRPVAAAVAIGAICALVANTLPAFLAVLAHERGLTEIQSGFCAMADLGGIAAGVILCALVPALVRRLDWRGTVRVGLLLLVLGNLLSIEVTAYVPYLVTRLLAGVGAGFGMAIGYAILAEGDGARSVAWFNIGQLGSGWFAIPYFTLLANRHGVGILFGLLAAFAAAVWPLAAWLPRMSARDSAAPASQEPHKDKVSLPGWVAIASVFVFFIGTGAVFGFLSFMGAAWGVAPLAVENDVSKILLVGMCTAAVVAVIGSRFGHVSPTSLPTR